MDPVTLQVMSNALRAVAEEMEAALVRTAHSPNITERRDCSTALFDTQGRMVVQAAAIPVHLGAMPEAVAAVMEHPVIEGDVWIVNDPYRGGTHLPDLTLISPLHVDGTHIGFAVSRAHHADVGGMAPGSMPAGSRDLLQEGLVLPPVRLSRAGVLDPDIHAIICANSRTQHERDGDLLAQHAAHRLADARVVELCRRYGTDMVVDALAALLDYGERRTRAAITAMPDGRYEATEQLEDDGAGSGPLAIHVAITINGDRMEVDFTGTAPACAGNFNCPLAVTRSAVYFVVRCVTDPDIPASAGAFAPVAVHAPVGCLVNAVSPHAVAAGNVETSSRIVDVVFAAFSKAILVPAQGQGTMNSLTIGGPGFTYYETIAGGQGASPNADGPSAVHVAMSNTLNTPVEMLETAYPLRVESYRVRPRSGGFGHRTGGHGVERSIRVLVDCEASIISERRVIAPKGVRAGFDGARGNNAINGTPVAGSWRGTLQAGDLITIQTPGGGGWGAYGSG